MPGLGDFSTSYTELKIAMFLSSTKLVKVCFLNVYGVMIHCASYVLHYGSISIHVQV